MTRRRGPATFDSAPRARRCARSTAPTRTTPPTPPPGSHPRHAGPAAPLHPGTSRDSSTHMGCRPYPQAPKQRLLTHTFAPDRHKGRGEGMPSPGAWGDQPAAGSRHQTAGRRPGGQELIPPPGLRADSSWFRHWPLGICFAPYGGLLMVLGCRVGSALARA